MKKIHLKDFQLHFKKSIKEIQYSIHERHIKRTTLALLLTLPYLLSEWGGRAYNLYIAYPAIDNFIHAFFGIAFASVAYLIYNKNTNYTLTASFAAAVLWEGLEIIGDAYVPAAAVLKDPFFYDGAKDILVTFVSSIGANMVLRRVAKKSYITID